MRKGKKTTNIDENLENQLTGFADNFYDNSEQAYSDEMKAELKKAIFNLKPHYREIILAIDVEGYSYKEIAHETGIPIGTLMSRRHRAISILFKDLENKKNNS